ncbi:MAG: hypothetical protein Q9164_003452 [Protoblastenia rupestris]
MGFLAGDRFEDEGGFENVGLSDHLVALQWVQDQITKSGGDPTKTTVMGQPAGASSIQHHITSNGGEGKTLPFQQVILQSPSFFPNVNRQEMDELYDSFLAVAGARDLDRLRQLNTSDIIWSNAVTTCYPGYGHFGYGPVVDSTYVPELTSELQRKSKFHQNITVMMLQLFPHFDATKLHELLNTLYPIPEDSDDEKANISQVAKALGDLAVNCNSYYHNKARNGKG